MRPHRPKASSADLRTFVIRQASELDIGHEELGLCARRPRWRVRAVLGIFSPNLSALAAWLADRRIATVAHAPKKSVGRERGWNPRGVSLQQP
jgi:hypothetical protein